MTPPPVPQPWLSAEEMANTANISVQKARRALQRAGEAGETWRKTQLQVRWVAGRGSKGGKWEVSRDSLLAALKRQGSNSEEGSNSRQGSNSEAATPAGFHSDHQQGSNSVPNPVPHVGSNSSKQGSNSVVSFGHSNPVADAEKTNPAFGTGEVVPFMKKAIAPYMKKDSTPGLPAYMKTLDAVLTETAPDLILAHGDCVTVDEFAALAGCGARQARKYFAAGSWQGFDFSITSKPAAGVPGGEVRVVLLSDLPAPLFERAKALVAATVIPTAALVDVAEGETQIRPRLETDAATRVALWRLDLISPALAFPRRSPERGAKVLAAAGRHRLPSGATRSVEVRILYNWIKLYEEGGLNALKPKERARGTRRVMVSTAWDAAAPLPVFMKTQVADELERYVRSLWAAGTNGWRHVCQLSSAKLIELSQGAGWQGEVADLMPHCQVPRRMAENWRSASLVALSERDAKAYFDRVLPRIKRTRNGMMPGDVVVGDVHHMDVLFRRDDGSEATPKMITWHDIATNRMYVTLILLEKGEGVKRIHVAMSFAAMVKAWGLPKRLYLDNGSEYSWAEMLAGFAELAGFADDFQVLTLGEAPEMARAVAAVRKGAGAVIRARPYNAPAKPVEGQFSNLEANYLSMMDGWIGGNRMNSKTKNVGKKPEPFDGTWAEFHENVATLLAYYHTTPQRGWLDGKTPNEALVAAIASGWGKVAVAEHALLLSFADEDTRVIDRGCFPWGSTTYRHDALLPMPGRKVRVRVAKHDPRFAFVFDGDNLLCVAEPRQEYEFLDGAGAREQARQAKVLRRHIAEARADCDRLDLVDEARRHIAQKGAAPEIPTMAQIDISPEAKAMAEAMQQISDERAASPKPQKIVLSQYATDEDALYGQEDFS
ncbi:MAG: Mu transposase C-terminal domain-containing protein [Rhodospirillaceae bacterium]|nr:Mu transposase C-terminal domain-containing protein [Rhodospirillales bacterium]